MYTNKWIPLTEEQKAEYMNRMRDNMEMLRARAHVSQTGLGNILGLTRQTVSAMENGTAAMSWRRYLALAFFFGTFPRFTAVVHEPGREITTDTTPPPLHHPPGAAKKRVRIFSNN